MEIPSNKETEPNSYIIWIVDDEEEIRNMLPRFFGDIPTETFASAEEALDHLKKTQMPPDLLVTNINMQGPNGNVLAKEIAQHPSIKHLPAILAMSGKPLEEEAKKTFEESSTVFEFIRKPPDFGSFYNTCADLLKKREVKKSPNLTNTT